MIDAISSAQRAMNQQQLELESVAQNISNIHTPAYKRQLSMNGAFEEALGSDKSSVETAMTVSNLQRQGMLDKTNARLDLAIKGSGFFVVQLKEGYAVTRRGDFHLNKNGTLVTFDGHPVMTQNGSIRMNNDQVSIKSDGSIYQDESLISKLSIVHFNKPDQLKALGNGYYLANEADEKEDSKHSEVKQGFLEQSNIKSVDEMTEMMRISREFQTAQRLMRQADEMMNQAINNLGEG